MPQKSEPKARQFKRPSNIQSTPPWNRRTGIRQHPDSQGTGPFHIKWKNQSQRPMATVLSDSQHREAAALREREEAINTDKEAYKYRNKRSKAARQFKSSRVKSKTR